MSRYSKISYIYYFIVCCFFLKKKRKKEKKEKKRKKGYTINYNSKSSNDKRWPKKLKGNMELKPKFEEFFIFESQDNTSS